MNKIQFSDKVEEYLFNNRELFFYTDVNDKSVLHLMKQIKVLDSINNKPIKIWLNSSGGSTTNGLALIYTIEHTKSKIITIINNEVCSMGAHISVCGDERWMVKNGAWMAHDMSGGIDGDYSGKVRYRATFIEKHYGYLEDNYRKHTKLSEEDLKVARDGELWLDANQCLEKGVVDRII